MALSATETELEACEKSMSDLSDQELIKAINLMTFDHGETEIWVSSPK